MLVPTGAQASFLPMSFWQQPFSQPACDLIGELRSLVDCRDRKAA